MPKASILYLVPDDPEDVAGILADNGVEEGTGGCTDAEEIADFLRPRAGTVAEAYFDLDDPMEPIEALAPALERVGSRYFAAFDAFEERSRGIRVLGRVYVNMTGRPDDRRRLEVAWTDGAPSLDERTLTAAGMERGEAEAVCAAFLTEPAPARAP